MTDQPFEPKIVAFVCNWCTYLGADLAGTNRLEYPANVRIIRLPCTGRIDFNLIVKAFETGADAVLVSGAIRRFHSKAGNFHRGGAGFLFRAQSIRWRRPGPHSFHLDLGGRGAQIPAGRHRNHRGHARQGPLHGLPQDCRGLRIMIDQLRQICRRLLDGKRVDVVIGYGEGPHGGAAIPVFIRRAEDADRLIWNKSCLANLTTYLKRPEVRALGRAATSSRAATPGPGRARK